MSRYCFVLPRYFEGIAGGAETLMGVLAQRLQRRGDQVEIFTTCARDNRTWDNEFSEGQENVAGVLVSRFEVDHRDLEKWIPTQLKIHDGQQVSVDEQLVWMAESVNSTSLYQALHNARDSFDTFFFGPYLFGTTFWGSMINPSKSVLIPCLHDESYAYQDVIASMFRQVSGCLFNAEPEMHLAKSLYGDIPGAVVGMGFVPPTESEIAELKPYFTDNFPYIIYIGRKETGKNVQVLIDYFCAAKNQQVIPPEVKLVILGAGSFDDLHRPAAKERFDIIDLPHVSECEKQQLIKHALYLCQPSTNESFSIVLMEAWMLGTPVVVHSGCAVTKHHVVVSGGGLYFSSSEDLGAVTRTLTLQPDLRGELASAGAAYVKNEYSWKAVLERFDSAIAACKEGSLRASLPT